MATVTPHACDTLLSWGQGAVRAYSIFETSCRAPWLTRTSCWRGGVPADALPLPKVDSGAYSKTSTRSEGIPMMLRARLAKLCTKGYVHVSTQGIMTPTSPKDNKCTVLVCNS